MSRPARVKRPIPHWLASAERDGMRWLAMAERYAEPVALAWALGLALYTATYFMLYLIGVPLGVAIGPALIAAVAGVKYGLRAVRIARRDEPGPGDRATPLILGVAFVLGLFQLLTATWVAVRSQLHYWDAWFVWGVKARMFTFDGPPPGYFSGALGVYAHPDYPLNLPLAEATLFRLPDPPGVQLAALIGPACLAALLLLFYTGLARLYGRDSAALATVFFALMPWLPRQAGLGLADIPLALYGGAAALYLMLWWRWRRQVDLVLMGLLAGGAIWTKKEGVPIAALLLLAFIGEEILRRRTRRERPCTTIGLGVGATLLLPLPWLLFTRIVHPPAADLGAITLDVFLNRASRLPQIAQLVSGEMLTLSHWSVLWMASGLMLVLTGIKGLSRVGKLLFLLLVGHLGVYMAGFLFTYWAPYTAYVQTSIDRLLIHVVPWALLLLVEAVHSLVPARSNRAIPRAAIRATSISYTRESSGVREHS